MEILNGIDIERVSRFERIIEKPQFMKRVYTEAEQKFIARAARPERAAASSFSAKEAVSKAFGRGLYGMLPNEIEVLRLESGKPYVRLLGSALESYGDYALSLSVSYSDDHVVTSCIAYKE